MLLGADRFLWLNQPKLYRPTPGDLVRRRQKRGVRPAARASLRSPGHGRPRWRSGEKQHLQPPDADASATRMQLQVVTAGVGGPQRGEPEGWSQSAAYMETLPQSASDKGPPVLAPNAAARSANSKGTYANSLPAEVFRRLRSSGLFVSRILCRNGSMGLEGKYGRPADLSQPPRTELSSHPVWTGPGACVHLSAAAVQGDVGGDDGRVTKGS